MSEEYQFHLERLRRKHAKRNSLITEWDELYNLADQNQRSGYESGVGNDPRAFMNLAIHFLSAVPDKPRIVARGEDPATRRTFSAAERALVGIARTIDNQYASTGRGWWWRDAAYKACLTGSLYMLSCVLEDTDGSPIFVSENWETKDCYPEWGERELRRFIHEYECPIAAVEEKAELHSWRLPDLPAKLETVNIVDYWVKRDRKVWHAVLLNDSEVQPLEDSLFEDIPVRGGPIAEGNSALETNKGTWKTHDKLYSYILEAVHRAVQGMIVVHTDRDIHVFDPSDWKTGEGIIKHLQTDEKIVNVEISRVPAEAIAVLNKMSSDMQRGGFSYALYGGITGQPWAGYAIAQLIAGTLSVIGPYNVSLLHSRGQVYWDWLSQFKAGNFKPILVSGNYNGRMDGYFHDKFGRKDVPNFLYVEVKRPLALPDNTVERLAAARQAAPQVPELLSLQTIMDEILDVDDPQGEMDKITEELVLRSPEKLKLDMVYHFEQLVDEMRRQGRQREARILQRIAENMLSGQTKEAPGVVAPGAPPETGALNASREDMVRSLLGAPQATRAAARRGVELGGKEI